MSAIDPGLRFEGIISRSPALESAVQRVKRVAPTDATVLITGETGTGKELVARAIHRRSRRAAKPLVSVNLAAIPDTLIASELFGHEQGAFTGAIQRRLGRFELADKGTLFLDEVGELTPEVQVSLLRAVECGEFERLGGTQTRVSDTRVIAATHRTLEDMVEQGKFRSDLYYRLNVFPVHLPALRERKEDIPLLAMYFLEQQQRPLNRAFSAIDPASLARLTAFDWPGNIRQLQNVIEHAAILCDGPVLEVPQGLLAIRRADQGSASTLARMLRVSQLEMIEEALEMSEGRVSGAFGAAARLGVPASTLESKIRKLGIDKFRYRSARQVSA
jgi:transcriptional regulator with GAF, ATPase, and Fis domain